MRTEWNQKWRYNDQDQQVLLPFCRGNEILFQMRPDRRAGKRLASPVQLWKLRSKPKPKFQHSILVTSCEVQLKINILNAFVEMFSLLGLMCFIIPFNLWRRLVFLIETIISICWSCISFSSREYTEQLIALIQQLGINIQFEQKGTPGHLCMRIWSNGMIDQRNRDLNAVADVAESAISNDNLQWYMVMIQRAHSQRWWYLFCQLLSTT